MIPREIAAEILARTDIAALISNYVTLKRAGSNLNGLCPFHSERTPSFTVFTASNSFYCFGCGAGGDAITFLRRIENLEYSDALEQLAKRAGVQIPHTPSLHEGRRYDRNRFYEMNRDAARFFHSCLLADNPSAREALAYLEHRLFVGFGCRGIVDVGKLPALAILVADLPDPIHPDTLDWNHILH